MDYRCRRIVCIKCGRKRKDCECPYVGIVRHYWCTDLKIGAYCEDCKNRFECYTCGKTDN